MAGTGEGGSWLPVHRTECKSVGPGRVGGRDKNSYVVISPNEQVGGRSTLGSLHTLPTLCVSTFWMEVEQI